MARVLVACLLVLVLSASAFAAGPLPVPWQPSQSYPGGTQYDARLDQPIALWVTGASLATTFASLTEQTGVALGFDPPGDENERICVTLYLSPTQPPSLRALLAQLAWVTDCVFATAGSGDTRSYALLSTSVGTGALARREEALAAERRARQERQRQTDQDLWRQTRAKLPELRHALELSREEALAQYADDPPMLLTLLDPARRAGARFVLSLPESKLDALGPNWSESIRWEELSDEQRQSVKEALQPWLELEATRQARQPRPGFPWTNWAEAERLGLSVGYAARPTGFSLHVEAAMDSQEAPAKGWSVYSGDIPSPLLVADPRWASGMYPEEAIALRRLRGEQISPEHERQEAAQRTRQEGRTTLEGAVARTRRLSAGAVTRLSAVQIPIDVDKAYSTYRSEEGGRKYALWQLQEAVAVASGFSVISDCTMEPARTLSYPLWALFPDSWQEPNVLEMLTAACVPGRGSSDDPLYASWEWGDAGSTLHFRNVDRATAREAMLPPSFVAAMDRWLAPHLPDLSTPEADLPPATVPLDVRAYAPLVQQLSLAQHQFGRCLVVDGDIAGPQGWYRRAFRAQFLEALAT